MHPRFGGCGVKIRSAPLVEHIADRTLRVRRAHPKLRDIRIIVWTAMGETEQRLSEYFGVQKVVPKWAGPKELEQAVRASAGGCS